MFSRVLRANRYSKISRFRRFTKTIKKKSPTIKHRSAALLQLSIPLAFHLEQRYKSLSFSQEFGIERKKILLIDSIFIYSNRSSREEFSMGGIFSCRISRNLEESRGTKFSIILILTLHVRLIKSGTDFSTPFYLRASSLFREHLALNSSYTQGKQCPCDRQKGVARSTLSERVIFLNTLARGGS